MHGNDNAILGAQDARSGISGADWYLDSQMVENRNKRPFCDQETALAKWTPQLVADRLEEAASTLRRLPSGTPRGHYSFWPDIVHDAMEAYGWNEAELRLGLPSGEAITRMDEAMEWLRWLEAEDVKLVWMRATRIPWKLIAGRLAYNRSTAWRKWTIALNRIASRLEARQGNCSSRAGVDAPCP